MQANVKTVCDRCNGRGGWEGWPGFTCYKCGGKGSLVVSSATAKRRGFSATTTKPAPTISKPDYWRNAGRDVALANEPCDWQNKAAFDYAHYYREGWAIVARDNHGQDLNTAYNWTGTKRRPDGTLAN